MSAYPAPSSGSPPRHVLWVLILLLVIVVAVYIWLSVSRQAVPPGSLVASIKGPTITRNAVLELARSYAEHRWVALPESIRHGVDAKGVLINTPNVDPNAPAAGRWDIGTRNKGIPYKWGGFDTPQSFDAGLLLGKAAGDIYSSEKRRRGNASVSNEAIGIDCSGFISRCWRLPQKLGTSTLPGVCALLNSPSELQPGDIMDSPHGHVVLFSRWLDGEKTNALFYEAEAVPEPRVTAGPHSILWLQASGARPYRYVRITD